MGASVITVFGSINVDLVCHVAAAPRPGETVIGSDYLLYPGGKGANQALAARRAGARVRLVGAIGNDPIGSIALVELRAAEVDLRGVARLRGTTGLALVTVDRDNESAIVVAPGANCCGQGLGNSRRRACARATRSSSSSRCRSPRCSPWHAPRGRPALG